MQVFQKLKITTPANENQAAFGRKDTKINTPRLANRLRINPQHSAVSRTFFSNLLEIKLKIWYNTPMLAQRLT